MFEGLGRQDTLLDVGKLIGRVLGARSMLQKNKYLGNFEQDFKFLVLSLRDLKTFIMTCTFGIACIINQPRFLLREKKKVFVLAFIQYMNWTNFVKKRAKRVPKQ